MDGWKSASMALFVGSWVFLFGGLPCGLEFASVFLSIPQTDGWGDFYCIIFLQLPSFRQSMYVGMWMGASDDASRGAGSYHSFIVEIIESIYCQSLGCAL